MPATEQDLLEFLARLGVETETTRHPPVFTVEEAKAHRGDLPGAHTKKGGLWLVVAMEDTPVNLKDLRHRIGAPTLSFGKPELLTEVLGIEPGSVTPFAVINDVDARVRVVLDAEMMKSDRLNYHPLTNVATTAISPHGLLTFLRACGHDPLVVAI